MTEILLRLKNIDKIFPGVKANDDVTFDIDKGTIHALLGENGAGKSTLVKIIYGSQKPDGGSMELDGVPFAPKNPADARAKGVGMVFQHFSLFDALSVRENISLAMRADAVGSDLRERIIEVSNTYGLPLDPDRLVGTLSVGERQRVEIVRCLLQDPELLIMDEPTSVLTPQEVDILFVTLRRLASEGVSILYISHKLEEIRALCSHATIMRLGAVVGDCDPREESAKSLAEMMIGEKLREPKPATGEIGDIIFKIDGLHHTSDDAFGVDLRDINLDVHAGEIIGIAGVAGNGQEDFMAMLIGEISCDDEATLVLQDVPVGKDNPTARRARGMGFVPEERLGHGAVPSMSLWENTVLSDAGRKQIIKSGLISEKRARDYGEDIISEYDVRTPGIANAARSLSGGNLQKFIMGREILHTPTLLVVSQPTWGVDAGAASAIHQALIDMAAEGAAVIVISQDLDELMILSTRLCVIADGALSQPIPIGEASVEKIGLLMGGTQNVA